MNRTLHGISDLREAVATLKWAGLAVLALFVFFLAKAFDALVPILRRWYGGGGPREPLATGEAVSAWLASGVLLFLVVFLLLKGVPALIIVRKLTRPLGRAHGDHASPLDPSFPTMRWPRLTAPPSLPSLQRIPDAALSAGEYSDWPEIDEAFEGSRLEEFSVPLGSEIAVQVMFEAIATAEGRASLGRFPLLGIETRVCDADERWWSTLTWWSASGLHGRFLEVLEASTDKSATASVELWDHAPRSWHRAFLTRQFLQDFELTLEIDRALDLRLGGERWVLEKGEQALSFDVTWLEDEDDFVVRAKGVTLYRGNARVGNVTLCFRWPREHLSPLHAPGEHVPLPTGAETNDTPPPALPRGGDTPLLFRPAHRPGPE